MLDKIRLHGASQLDPDYHENLGRGADARCTGFLRVPYEKLRTRVLQGGTDEEILEWCYQTGRRLDEGDVTIWTGFATKLGWNDFASSFLAEGKQKYGFAERDDIQTIPQMMDADEGRPVRQQGEG